MTRTRTKVLALSLTSIAVALTVFAVLAWAYLQPKERLQSVDPAELVIGAPALPVGWHQNSTNPSPIPKDALIGDYRAKRGNHLRLVADKAGQPRKATLWHRVLEYQNQLQALEAFYLDYPRAFYDSSRRTPWIEPDSWTYQSPNSNRFRFACAGFETIHGIETVCTSMAQYEEFISVFSTDLLSTDMTLDDIERVLRSVDQRFEDQLRTAGE